MHRIIRQFIGFFTIVLSFSLSANTSDAASRLQDYGEELVIVIDPGHGGENEGTIENGFLEKEMTLKTAIALYDELTEYDNVTVYLTRTEDSELSLADRAAYASSVNADFLFSIHYNASVSHRLYGTEVWVSCETPYHAYGYQFGMKQMETMRDRGLFLRGVKTKFNDRGTDYYGILRESAALAVPAVIIEHCHVDNDRESSLCDGDDELIAFGRADATSIAQYFGLKSESLGVDYSGTDLVEAYPMSLMSAATDHDTDPDECSVSILSSDVTTGELSLSVTAFDADEMLLYYDYSLDGGATYSDLFDWPGSDIFTGLYDESFTLDLTVPSGISPEIIVRAYNKFDGFVESPILHTGLIYDYGHEEESLIEETSTAETSLLPDADELPAGSPARERTVSIGGLKITFRGLIISWCVAVGVVLLLLLINLRRK